VAVLTEVAVAVVTEVAVLSTVAVAVLRTVAVLNTVSVLNWVCTGPVTVILCSTTDGGAVTVLNSVSVKMRVS
jgi:hypothetical protein